MSTENEVRKQTNLLRREIQRQRFNDLVGSARASGGTERLRHLTDEQERRYRELRKVDFAEAERYRAKCQGPTKAFFTVAVTAIVVAAIVLLILGMGVHSVGGLRFG